MANNTVSNLQQFQERSEELRRAGYVAIRPGEFCTPGKGSKAFSWNDYVHSMLISEANMTAQGTAGSQAARRQISTIFASSGGECRAKPKGEGTECLVYM